MTTRMRAAALAGGMLLGASGCTGGPAAADRNAGPAPVAVAAVDVVTNTVPDPDPGYAATCETGAIVRLIAGASYDPLGQPLAYEWRDRVAGQLTPDFGPGQNPLQTPHAETGVLLATIAVHDIELTVTAPDGRKARTTVSVLVRSCVVCGGP